MTQIRMPLSRQIISIAIALSFLTVACGEKKETTDAKKAIPVSIKTVTEGTILDTSEFVGNLEAVRRVELAPQIEGRIETIFVTNGTPVSQGQKILLLKPIKQQEQVNSAIGDVNTAKGSLAQTEAELQTAQVEKARSADEVARSQAELAKAESELQSREADVKETEAEVELATIDFNRSKFLVESGVRAQQDLDDKTRTLKTRQAQLNSKRKIRDSAKSARNAAKEAVNVAGKNLQGAETRVQQALAKIDSAKAAVSAAQGNLGAVKQDLVYNTVVAPIQGTVSDIPFKVGDILRNGESFTKIVDNQRLFLNIGVPIERRSQLREGIPVEIVAADGRAGTVGTITFISPTVNQNAQTILSKVTFDNDGSLKDNQYVKVRVIWNKKPGILIPTSVVTNRGPQKFIYVAEGGKATEKPVVLGAIQGQNYQVISGLQTGEKLIVSRIQNLTNGVPISEESITSEKR